MVGDDRLASWSHNRPMSWPGVRMQREPESTSPDQLIVSALTGLAALLPAAPERAGLLATERLSLLSH
jgi:hypothetical protein